MKLGYMDKAISSETGHSGNMEDLPMSKKERVIACILATKFHTEPTIDSILEVAKSHYEGSSHQQSSCKKETEQMTEERNYS